MKSFTYDLLETLVEIVRGLAGLACDTWRRWKVKRTIYVIDEFSQYCGSSLVGAWQTYKRQHEPDEWQWDQWDYEGHSKIDQQLWEEFRSCDVGYSLGGCDWWKPTANYWAWQYRQTPVTWSWAAWQSWYDLVNYGHN